MKLLILSAMIFFGTLMAAGLVALGEPAGSQLTVYISPPAAHGPASVLVSARTLTGPGAASAPQR